LRLYWLIALYAVLRHNGSEDSRPGWKSKFTTKRRCPLDERDVMNTWRSLFHEKEITSRTLTKAEAMLDSLSGESPLHIRLAKELEELQKLQKKK
jgi:hypothetical protein